MIDLNKKIVFLLVCFVSLFGLTFGNSMMSTPGEILFKIELNQATPKMTLNENGLGIGITPSTNLHVAGNAVITQSLSIGNNTSSSNFHVNGSLGFVTKSISSDTTLGEDSFVFVDTSSSNLILSLPTPSDHSGKTVMIKKTSLAGEVFVSGTFSEAEPYLFLGEGFMGAFEFISTGTFWAIMSEYSNSTLLFFDNFDDSVDDSSTDPAARARGTLADEVKYNVSNNTSSNVIVTGGLLDWVGDNVTGQGQVDANGTQNFTFRTTPAGATYFDWGPYIKDKAYIISFILRSNWSHPLTFGLSDTAQAGSWNADAGANYDYAFGPYGSNWQSGEDGNSTNTSGSASNTEYFVTLRIDEPSGTATAFIDGEFVVTRQIDFENDERYFSFGEPTNYGGYLDEFKVLVED